MPDKRKLIVQVQKKLRLIVNKRYAGSINKWKNNEVFICLN